MAKTNGNLPKMSLLFANYFQAAVAHSKGDNEQTTLFLKKVIASTKKDGRSRMYRNFASSFKPN